MRALFPRFFRALWKDRDGGPAAEFTLVLPIMLLFIFGIIETGHYAWELNRAEKAAQIGARWAVATDMIPTGLVNYSFSVSGGIEQGEPVPISAFPGLRCTGTASSASCTCKTGGTCAFPLTANNAAFANLLTRMQRILPGLQAGNVTVHYDWSGLGYAGDPNGPDVAPHVTVELHDIGFTSLFANLVNVNFTLPTLRYSLTMEDGAGNVSN